MSKLLLGISVCAIAFLAGMYMGRPLSTPATEVSKATAQQQPLTAAPPEDKAVASRSATPVPARSIPSASPDEQANTPTLHVSDSLGVPAGNLDEQTHRSAILTKLLNASRIECNFGPGAGGLWSAGAVQPHSAAWQGGPIVFQNIDRDAGNAQMTGSAGATGSSEGEMDVRLTSTTEGLHFIGVARRSPDLVVITVYDALDDSGNYRAAMSRHGASFANESAQFYGSCETY